jgi:DNA-nicking Smr family endonuclease
MGSRTIAQQKDVNRQKREAQFVNTGQKHSAEVTSIAAIPKAAEDLLQPLESSAYLPHQLKKSKKKKLKRISL